MEVVTAVGATEIKGNRVAMTTMVVATDSEEVAALVVEVTIGIETLAAMAQIPDGRIITEAVVAIKVEDIKEAVVVVDTMVEEGDNHMVEEDHPFTVVEATEEVVVATMTEEEVMGRRRTLWAFMVMIARTQSWRWNSFIPMKSRLRGSILIRFV